MTGAQHLVRALSPDMEDHMPIPPRIIFEWDDHKGAWIAFFDGTDHVGPYGHGSSKAEAEADLEKQCGDGSEWNR